jgi:hypothetical protein
MIQFVAVARAVPLALILVGRISGGLEKEGDEKRVNHTSADERDGSSANSLHPDGRLESTNCHEPKVWSVQQCKV